ncbi:nitrous oxide reductase family maturation protein NosD [Mangrovivirga sp. M17]|uniref:Nitrous oxide reductase family maturation protein NosD n=1 Tax=Mangrovivirga halotolerans TaxID=2993936 RepID=A0ABT3RQU9_9BACT|nr:nitrous oxide reductase family maturation protein NosD [Mangrovivirga halotolerans]MCX2743560.1 nitrous oxide reductase family maturation protein NosD [Mangrovivirga halotolerans]
MKNLLFLFTLISVATNLHSQTIEVCPDCQYTSIKEAIKSSSPHDAIIIKNGVYREGNITIDKPLSIIGKDYPVIDGESKYEIFTIKSDSVTLRGLKLLNVGVSYTKDLAAINIINSDYVNIKDNILENSFFGVYYQKSSYGLIEGNVMQGNAVKEISSGNAIHLWHCDNMQIIDNQVRNHRDGIYLEFVDSSRIVNNVSEGNLRYGLHFMFSNWDDYISNTLRDNGAGVAVMFSRFIRMEDNLFEKNWGTTSYGLLLKEIYDAEIINNEFYKNTIGIYGESATRIKISNNEFHQNGWALKILGSCMDNEVVSNNFIGNTFDVTTNSSRNYNIYNGNYWDEYTGYDLDKDGYGDVPYRPVSLFSHVITKSESSIILLRSLFVDLLNYAEKVTPVFTPESLKDELPKMKPIQ